MDFSGIGFSLFLVDRAGRMPCDTSTWDIHSQLRSLDSAFSGTEPAIRVQNAHSHDGHYARKRLGQIEPLGAQFQAVS
jgi:hypothetical protein